MTSTTAISLAITSLNEAHRRFGLTATSDPQFFPEWYEDLPFLSAAEQQIVDHLRDRYLYYAADGAISEGAVNFILVSPVLEVLGVYDPPYKGRGEAYVRVEIESEAEVLEGRIDALVIQDQVWVILIEAKRYGFSVLQAIPQALAYLTANSAANQPRFAWVTTGEDSIFLKLDPVRHVYGQSHKFTILSDENHNLTRVLRVLKRILQNSGREIL
ncbi:MAG: type I restriction endonuclease subunit R [Synechococcaceae cyanobacterium SM2_3_1]|nr:type I restriction endonuclease subunit R [Synechococcaceae cyanobacterium SM2_3_1]